MNREIKFRGLGKNGWIYGIPSYDFKYIFNKEQLDSIDNYEVNPETVGQFTIVKDKNGNEIYEGDLDEDYNLVHWCDKCHGWQFAAYDLPTKQIIFCHNCDGNFMFEDNISDIKIIGNIYEKK